MNYVYPKKDHQIHFYFVDEKLTTDLREVRSWDTFRLIPNNRPIINPPQAKTTYIEVPGFNGKLDFSDVVAGRAYMDQRTGSLEFTWSGELPKPWPYGRTALQNLELSLREIFNGRLFNIVLDDDPYYFYRGRVQLDSISVDASGSGTSVSLAYTLQPFKYKIQNMTNPRTPISVVAPDVAGSAYYSKSLSAETVQVPIKIHVVPALLYIYTTGSNVYFGTNTINNVVVSPVQLLKTGLNKIKKPLPVGDSILTMNGTGTVIVNYVEGRL